MDPGPAVGREPVPAAEWARATAAGSGQDRAAAPAAGPIVPEAASTRRACLKEVKADYTEEARQRGVAGDVVMEIVIRSDGSVGDVKILQGLAGGLNDRAILAVRQWRFAPAKRLGAPVDVIVEVAVEFKLR